MRRILCSDFPLLSKLHPLLLLEMVPAAEFRSGFRESCVVPAEEIPAGPWAGLSPPWIHPLHTLGVIV